MFFASSRLGVPKPYYPMLITPSHPQKGFRPFTYLDKACRSMIIDGLWFFPDPPHPDTLAGALEQLLAFYPLLAGRIEGDRGITWGNGGGVQFDTAQSPLRTDEASTHPHVRSLFLPGLTAKAMQQGRVPLFAARLTRLADGCVLGVQCSHACADGAAFYTLMDDWGRLSRQLPVEAPCLDAEAFPRPADFTREEALRQVTEAGWAKVGLSTLLRQLGREARGITHLYAQAPLPPRDQLAAWRQEAAQRQDAPVGSYAVLAAWLLHACRRLNATPPLLSGSIVTVCNLRGRIPSLPRKYAGNAVVNLVARGFHAGMDIPEAAARLQAHLHGYLADNGHLLADYVRLNACTAGCALPRVPFDVDDANGKRPAALYINDMRRFPVYALDFGTGQPSLALPPDLPDPIRLWPSPPGSVQPLLYLGGHMARRYNRLQPARRGWWG